MTVPVVTSVTVVVAPTGLPGAQGPAGPTGPVGPGPTELDGGDWSTTYLVSEQDLDGGSL